jgi:hypothetical protein
MKKHHSFLLGLFFCSTSTLTVAQCASESNIYAFSYDGTNYEIVKEAKNWEDAAACAVERGGFLAIINSAEEQEAIYNAANTDAGIVVENTTAPDGGGGSYIWLGGTDKAAEGDWIWDGNDDGSGEQFWQGTSAATGGTPVGGIYSNWGNEPDDFGSGQDALGLALTNWPLGTSGQWNDVASSNTLYFVIEYPDESSIEEQNEEGSLLIYPNPSKEFVMIENNTTSTIKSLSVLSEQGQLIEKTENTNAIDIRQYSSGTYIIQIEFDNGFVQTQKFIK